MISFYSTNEEPVCRFWIFRRAHSVMSPCPWGSTSFRNLTIPLRVSATTRGDHERVMRSVGPLTMNFCAECRLLLKPGGTLGCSMPANEPGHSMWQPDIRSAFASFPFEAPFPEKFPNQMHDHGKWSDAEWVGAHLQERGFTNVSSRIIRDETYMESADMFMMLFGGMLGWIMNGWWSEETREAHPLEEVKELTRKHLEEKYGGKGWTLKWAVLYAVGHVEK